MTAERNADQVLRRLEEIATKSPELRVTARLYEALLPAWQKADVAGAVAQFDGIELGQVLKGGTPLLAAADIEVDLDGGAAVLLAMLRAVGELEPPAVRRSIWRRWGRPAEVWSESEAASLAALRRSARELLGGIDAGEIDPAELLALAASGDLEGFSARVARGTADWELPWTVAHHALRPFLHEVRSRAPLEEIGVWQRGECYVCGAAATFAELQDDDQVKHLRCTECGADWHHPRLQCHHCGNEDHATLRYLYVAGSDHRRVEVCDVCRSYLKVIASFTPTATELLVVEDLATLELDFLAQQNGYCRPCRGVAL
ncbi:MAG: formate dehydrogenase accessory protein FdhE [Geobacter sp.]|nr:MAG: formate dehydrogenase accessory protein FdhE [Geobacter sp.]